MKKEYLSIASRLVQSWDVFGGFAGEGHKAGSPALSLEHQGCLSGARRYRICYIRNS